ncbi:MAG: hypothetical protein KKB51_13175 [Candidatus Riflebacteria bacterium]|nr:hypothetical protein [Candidatus Riflebacteria bacterium]
MKHSTLILLVALLMAFETCSIAQEVMLVEQKTGQIILTNDLAVASGAKSVKTVGESEIMIFPTRSRKSVVRPRAERILSGIFSGRQEAESDILPTEESYTPLMKQRPVKQKAANTIAWINEGGAVYHDPFLECATGSERVWIDNVQDLCGLAPCEECFMKTAQAPEFIRKESGGLDLASATGLLSKQEFLIWASERLPLKNPGFITTQRLLIYPKMEMTDNGLLQLAREVEMAYRRHTWQVIEVIAKKSETDTGSISSFGEDSENGDTDE